MKISASIDSKLNQHKISVQTNDAAKEVHIEPKVTGYGSSINGAELLLLSLATCFCNDIYREAAKRDIKVTGVGVDFTGEFGADGEPGSNFSYKANVISDAPAEVINELIDHTDRIAEIHNTLRKGLAITLNK
ncbi:OsmC family protein [Mucilaginibacter jinjuensis]|uniref:OsmC family protein n=1 Tax=Mucilaginibacter jinjuensis TaxID=1176721 RepID=A0ABY7T657_9SPHI|nr:OsmC family protein [Mucilaginibacter jinjuensis]WCT11739.1 OsmC family protein [Mucilaginibacter jinjuensis]